MGAVAVGVGIASADGVVARGGAASELVVGLEDARVHDVGVGAAAGRVVVDVAGRARLAVGDGAQAPGGAILGDEGGRAGLFLVLLVEEVPNLVLLYLKDLDELVSGLDCKVVSSGKNSHRDGS